jgi:hypothetical protein
MLSPYRVLDLTDEGALHLWQILRDLGSSWSTRSTDSQWRRSGSFTFSTSASPDVHSFPEKTIRLPISLAFPRLVSI